MRGRGVIAGVLAMCGAVALSVPAHADQYDFISALDNAGVSYESITDMIDIGKALCHDLRSGGGAAGRARQTTEHGIRADRVSDHPDSGGEQHMPRHQGSRCRVGTRERLYRSGVGGSG